jgi:hypothetical protein
MRRPLSRFTGALETVVEGLEQLADFAVAHRMALPAQLFGQTAGALTGPTQWRHRVTACRRLHERIQGLEQLLILCREWLAACPLVANTSVDGGGCGRAR